MTERNEELLVAFNKCYEPCTYGTRGKPKIIYDEVEVEDTDDNDIVEQAKAVILEANTASTSFLQRKLSIGYSRAARIIDLLEEEGFVSEADGSKPRKILSEPVEESAQTKQAE